MRIVYFFILLAFTSSFVNAQTTVGGTISSNTTWNASGNPYIVTGSVTVNENVTLTIKPGVIVKFNKVTAFDFYIDGILRAIGTEDSMILFTSNLFIPHEGDWGGIAFGDPSTDYDFSSQTGSILRYCTFEWGSAPEVVYGNCLIVMDRSSPYIDHCIFRKDGSGVINVTGENAGFQITNNQFIGISGIFEPLISVLQPVASVGDISCNLFYACDGTLFGTNGNCNFHNNLMVNNRWWAISAHSSYIMAGDHFYNNTIVDNTQIKIFFDNSGAVDHNTITRNKVDNFFMVNQILILLEDTTATLTHNNYYDQIPDWADRL